MLQKNGDITRKEQDEFALSSQIKTQTALKNNKFKNEIIKDLIDFDEHPRPDVTLENLSNLKTVFKENGTVTVGNSSGINDGAAGVILMTRKQAEKKLKTFNKNRILGNLWCRTIINGIRSNSIFKKSIR